MNDWAVAILKLVISSSSLEAPLKTTLSSKRERMMTDVPNSRCGFCHTTEPAGVGQTQGFIPLWHKQI